MRVKLAELLEGLEDAEPRYVGCGPSTEATGLCVDSREVASRPGCAFLAIIGSSVDAHRFVDSALRDGAAVVFVQSGQIPPPHGPHVWLRDTTEAYPQLAMRALGNPASRLRLAAITGTNGKTTTTHLLASILRTANLPFTRLGTTGNWIVDHEERASFTTPFPLELQTLLRQTVDRGGTHGVMEASSHALAQGRVRPLKFDAIGFTSFSQDHLDFHPDMAAYLKAKCLLAEQHLATGGTAVAAIDDHPASQTFLEHARSHTERTYRVSRGAHRTAEILAESIEYKTAQTKAQIHTPLGSIALSTPLIAPYNLDNALVALGLALGLGIALDVAASALQHASGAPGRLERVFAEGAGGPVVVIDYAHTPDAVARALAAVRSICNGRIHIVLGCGGDRDASKRPQMGAAASLGADVFWATSDNPRTEDPAQIVDQMIRGAHVHEGAQVHRLVDRAQAIATAIEEAGESDLVLVAGKGHEDYQIIGETRIHFDDREHAQAALVRRR